MHTKRTLYILIGVLLFQTFTTESIIIKGNQEYPSFSFPIGAYSIKNNQYSLFIGAGDTSGDNYTIAQLNYNALQFVPLAPETITLNMVKDQTNPYRNQPIAHISCTSVPSGGIGADPYIPTFVTATDPKNIYLIKKAYSDGSLDVLSNIAPLLDASGGAETEGIVAIEGTAHSLIFAALRGNGEANFGDNNSAITLLGIGNDNVLAQKFVTTFNKASSFLTITSDLISIENNVAMHWDERLNRLFVGLQATGSADGARAIAVGQLTTTVENNQKIITDFSFAPIAPTTAFDSTTNKIVGFGAGAGSLAISIHKIRTLHTSNTLDNSGAYLGLSYLIVQGDVGSPSTTKSSVYALPLVAAGNAEIIGTLAKKDSTIVNIFTNQSHPVRTQHSFNEVATTPSDLFTKTDPSVIVGGGSLSAGNIEDMYVSHDTVFVSVKTANIGYAPGIFYSQAILNEYNAIVGWTPWQRFGNVTRATTGFATDHEEGFVEYLTIGDTTIDTIIRSSWNATDNTSPSYYLMQALQSHDHTHGSIQGFVDFSPTTPGLYGTNDVVGLLISTGYQKVILGQSGNNASGTFFPTLGIVSLIAYEDGTVSNNPPVGTKVVSFEGGALTDVGSIITATIVENACSNARLFVGGENGIAVLTDASGKGWDTNNTFGLGNNFEGIASGMSFKSFGNYRFVKKLLSYNDYLYVLTAQKLDRINISDSNFATNTLSVTTIAHINSLPSNNTAGALWDIVVKDNIALLATSFGLYRISNGSTITTTTENDWTSVSLPFTVGPVYSFQHIKSDGMISNVSNVYILCLDQGNNRSRVFRCIIKDATGTIDNTTMQLLQDEYLEGIVQYYANPGNAVQTFKTDSALTLFGFNSNQAIAPSVSSTHKSPLTVNLQESSTIVSLTSDSASGSRLIVTNNQIFVNEATEGNVT